MVLANVWWLLCCMGGCSDEDDTTTESTPPVCELDLHPCEGYVGPLQPTESDAGPIVDSFAGALGATLMIAVASVDTLEDGCEEWIPEWPESGCPNETWVQNQAWSPRNAFEQYTPYQVWGETRSIPPDEFVTRHLLFEGQDAVGLMIGRYQDAAAIWCVNDDFIATSLVYGDSELIMGCQFPPLPGE